MDNTPLDTRSLDQRTADAAKPRRRLSIAAAVVLATGALVAYTMALAATDQVPVEVPTEATTG